MLKTIKNGLFICKYASKPSFSYIKLYALLDYGIFEKINKENN